MAEVTLSSELPSSVLCDRVAVLTEEGLELESRMLAFAAEACELVRDFDDEVGPHLEGLALDRAAIRCGEAVRALHDDLRSTAQDAPEPVKKALAQAFVHELRVLDHWTVKPRFYVLPGLPTDSDGQPGRCPNRCACNDKQGGP